MKKCILLVFFSVLFYSVFAQKKDNPQNVIYNSGFAVSRPISEIFKENPVDENAVYEKEESEDRENRRPQKFRRTVKDGPEYGNDPKTIQDKMGTVPNRAPILNIAGQTASGFRPFDPSGASGPSHYVQMINSTTFRVYNKTTGAIILTGTLGNLWTPATGNSGDPIVMYDKAADRWFLAQFGSQANKAIYIAISTTNDPTGSYYTYTYTSPEFPDYLKFSVWSDGYYMTSNQTQKVFVFERTAMLAGNPSARAMYSLFSPPDGGGFFCPLPGDAADGTLPPAGLPCPIFSYSDNGWGAGFTDAVNIYQMTSTWSASPTSSISFVAAIPTAAFDASYDVNWNDVTQPGTAQKLDGIGGVCMYRAQWKQWSGYNTVVLNWGVKISSTQRSIKWVELRRNESTNTWSLYQEGIYTPDAETRWMGGIAMDNNGSIGLCYMKSSSTTFPGLYYTGRRECDPLGTLPIVEETVVAGTGSQTGTNRVGDYAHLALDPDGVTFYHTSEYMGGTTGGSASRTRIFSFQLPACGPTASVTITQTAGTNPMCAGANATFTATPVNGGAAPSYQWKVSGVNAGSNSPTFTSTFTNGQIVTCVMTSSIPGISGNPATSNGISLTVNPITTAAVSIAIASGTNPTCSGFPVKFTATPVNGGATPSYQWKVNGVNVGSDSASFTTSTLTNGQVVSCIMTSSDNCSSSPIATSNSITMTVTSNGSPTVSIAQTSGTNPMCNGASATFTATVTNAPNAVYQWQIAGVNAGTNSATFTTSSLTNGQSVSCIVTADRICPIVNTYTFGTGSSINATNSDVGNPYPTYYGNGRQQYLLRAAELTSSGVVAGNITALTFNVAGTTGDPATLNGYTIKMASTATTVLTSTFQSPGFITVYGPLNYTPVINSLNTHQFATPFVWNGSSNILIDICFSNQVLGVTAYQVYRTTSSFVSNTYYQQDYAAGAGACTATTGSTASSRPNMLIEQAITKATASSNAIAMTVNSSVAASVSIAQTAGTNPQCAGASVTFTATPVNGGATPTYQWKVSGVNAGTNSPTFTTSSLANNNVVTCEMTTSLACATPVLSVSNGITITVNPVVTPSVSISITSGTNPQCSGASVTFTATPVNGGATPSYQWKVNGTNAGANSNTFTSTTLTNNQVVTCVMTSNASCLSTTTATSSGITMTVNPNVAASVSISANPGNTICAGANVTFTATPTNGGTPTYTWKNGTTTVGANSATYSSSSLANGNSIICVMTSTASCATGSPATSNAITMVVNPVVTAGVSISANPGTTICNGQNVTFTAVPVNGGTPTYTWKNGTTTVGANSSTYSSSSLANSNTITCTMTSNANCVTGSPATSNGLTMTVNPNVTAGVTISANPGNSICAGQNVTFTAVPSNGGTPTYTWKNGTTTVGANSATYSSSSLANGNVITCMMTSTANCVTGSPATSNGITMNVTQNSPVSVTISANPGTTICSGQNVTFTAVPTNGGTPTYTWKNGSTTVGANSSTYSSSSLANGNVITCIMSSNLACTTGNPATSNQQTMIVKPLPAITSFNPVYGNTGTQVIISGSGFTGVNAVTFNGTPASSFTFNSDTQVVAFAPAAGTTGPIYLSTPCATAISAVNFTYTTPITVHLKILIEGFYSGGGFMVPVISPSVCDTITVSLANNLSPNSIAFSQTGTITPGGTGDFVFPAASTGNSYYIVVTHRNSLQTWSANPIVFSATPVNYDFTTAASQAYGNNLVNVDGYFAIQSGDVNQDGIVDITDFNLVESGAEIFLTGYVTDDLTGDGLVESSDYSIVEDNLFKFLKRP